MAAIKRVILPSVPVMLAEGTEVFVDDGSDGLDLYIGNSSNTPVLVSGNQFAHQDSVVDIADIVDNLTSTNVDKPLSANQGKVLNENKVGKVITETYAKKYNDVFTPSIGNGIGTYYALLCKTTSQTRGSGTILGVGLYSSRASIILNYSYVWHDMKAVTARLNETYYTKGGWMRAVTCNFNGEEWVAIELSAMGHSNCSRYFWNGAQDTSQTEILTIAHSSEVTGVTLHENSRPANGHNLSDNEYFSGNMEVVGTITASDFITASRVESDWENALQALDNISEWKKKDGSVDYEKHYAYKTREVKDEEGKVIRTEFGLSMEKRVAMLEKMVYELREENRSLKTQLEAQK